jgi:hypothetical protein
VRNQKKFSVSSVFLCPLCQKQRSNSARCPRGDTMLGTVHYDIEDLT